MEERKEKGEEQCTQMEWQVLVYVWCCFRRAVDTKGMAGVAFCFGLLWF